MSRRTQHGQEDDLLVIALGALALPAIAVPAAQGAKLTREGEALPLFSGVTATSSDLIMTTTSGQITCASVTVHGYVGENSPEVFIPVTGTTTEGCVLNAGGLVKLPTVVTAPEFGSIHLSEEEGWSSATFKYDVPAAGLANCHFEGFPEFAYESGSDVVSMPGSSFVAGGGSPPGCPTTGTTHGSFTLEDSTGTPLVID